MSTRKRTTKKPKGSKRAMSTKAAKAPAKEGKAKATKEPAEKVGGKFLASSETGKIFSILADGKKHAVEEIIKEIKPKAGGIRGKVAAIRKHGRESESYTIELSDGVLQMIK